MLRWKIFIPLAVLLTGLGLLGSYYWTASASSRSLSALNSYDNVNFNLEDNYLILSVKGGQALATTLENLETSEIKSILTQRELKIQRKDFLPVDSNLVQQVELILAQAAATHEYYEASLHLKNLAEIWGYESVMFIWEDRVVAELNDTQSSIIAQRILKGVSP